MASQPISDLKNKLFLVTGAARGISRSVAFEFAHYGATTILLDILDSALSTTASDARNLDYTVHPFICDVASHTTVAALRAKIISEIRVPNVNYNKAYWAPHGSSFNLDIEGIRKALVPSNYFSHLCSM